MADKVQAMAGYGQRFDVAYDTAIRKATPETLDLLQIPQRQEV